MQRHPQFERLVEIARQAVIGNTEGDSPDATFTSALEIGEKALSSTGADKATVATIARLVAQEVAQP